ncbi:protein kinase, putative [Leishmania donovani]|uniref:Protein kinase, putative n=1 Tax=Leishmania donovani TaxID=5661 RepID=E9BNI6_LEIDO|nr:protein kinase, putative [Leishmania donovani]CBZ36814.1 protein kinase, putative [Leishmania donovani]
MDSTLAKLPATRWDRLMAVLEENEPERAIDAPNILERAKKLNLSDLELFYLLLMRYQDKQPKILMDVVSLYAMMSTWMEWIVQVQRCLDAKKRKMDAGSPSHTATGVPVLMPTSSDFADSGRTFLSCPSSNCTNTPISSNPAYSSENYGNDFGSRPDSATHAARNPVSSTVRGFHDKSGRRSHSTSFHWCFDLGPDWKWDGSLDFLRNGRVLSCLVEEALDRCGKLEVLPDDHRVHPGTPNPITHEILYPSLADIDRVFKGAAEDGATDVVSASRSFSKLNSLSTLDFSRGLQLSRGDKAQPSKALKLIEEQGKNLAAAEQWVRKLNSMCERFLGWEKSVHENRAFFDLCNPDNLVRPLNSDDARLLYRMHWLAVALYRAVKDASIIPAPPRMSFIVCHDDLGGLPDTSAEDDEIGLLVATKCSCLPLKARLSVTMKDFNTMQLLHPDMKHGPRVLPCTIVKGEVFAYFEERHTFVPVWSVFQYHLQHFDGLVWCFEMSRQEREQERQVLGTNFSATRPDLGASDDFAFNGSSAAFDLTVHSSTVRHDRQRRPPESPGNTQWMRGSITPKPFDLPTDCKASVTLLPQRFPHQPAAQSGTGVEMGVSVSKVRLNRIAIPSPRPSSASPSPSSSPATTSRAADPFAQLSATPAAGTGITNNANAFSSTTCGVSTAVVTSASSSGIDAVLNAIKSPISDLSLSMTASRQATAVCTTGEQETPSTRIAYLLPPKRSSEALDESTENTELLSREVTVCMEAKTKEVVERDRIVGAAASDAAVLKPSCTISCSPCSQVMVTQEAHYHGGAEAPEEDDDVISDATMTVVCSESHTIIRNFTAAVVQESEQSGISILSHHFRVSSGPIGKGAFGAVYRALNLDTGRIVAVKQSRYSYDDKTADLNWREFQMWSMLPPHANVITFYGASREVDTNQLLLVMEYASGGSIVQLYRYFRPIPEPLFYDHAVGIARGLKHLHDHNVIHGDVKPENVLTRSDGSVAISDFGCSSFSLVSSDNGSPLLRSSKRESGSLQLFGTAAYMAPEVILNEPHLKSDVWAYACTLVQLWLGKSPWSYGERRFSALDSIPLMFYIANEEVVPFTTEQLERSPRWLQCIARRAFERDVERRCTMAEIISILADYSKVYRP